MHSEKCLTKLEAAHKFIINSILALDMVDDDVKNEELYKLLVDSMESSNTLITQLKLAVDVNFIDMIDKGVSYTGKKIADAMYALRHKPTIDSKYEKFYYDYISSYSLLEEIYYYVSEVDGGVVLSRDEEKSPLESAILTM